MTPVKCELELDLSQAKPFPKTHSPTTEHFETLGNESNESYTVECFEPDMQVTKFDLKI